MSLFKNPLTKKTPVVPAIVNEPSFHYPISIKSWNKHREGVLQLCKSLGLTLDDMEDGRMTAYLKCKLALEPDNEYDSDAVKVYASPRGAKYKTFYDIGYIPSEWTSEVMRDNKKVTSKTHYWNLQMRIDIISGTEFNLYLKESKFK